MIGLFTRLYATYQLWLQNRRVRIAWMAFNLFLLMEVAST